MTNPTVCQDDISIHDLSGQRMDTTWADRGADVVVQPAYKVVLHILRIFFHVSAGRSILIVHLNGVGQADVFERLVPGENSITNPASISNRCCMFDVEHDRLLGRTDLQTWISLFEEPAVDIANFGFPVVVTRQIGVRRREESDSTVSNSRLVPRFVRNVADGVVQDLQSTTRC